MKLKIGHQKLIQSAMSEIETVPLEKAQQFLDDPHAL